ncbi:hypothetical protein BW75_05085 [Escherichia coli O81:NM str. 02-3012]|nr:hypothetical protein BW75_05085 [Escherichia coli O81:NM str. 02-3012]
MLNQPVLPPSSTNSFHTFCHCAPLPVRVLPRRLAYTADMADRLSFTTARADKLSSPFSLPSLLPCSAFRFITAVCTSRMKLLTRNSGLYDVFTVARKRLTFPSVRITALLVSGPIFFIARIRRGSWSLM